MALWLAVLMAIPIASQPTSSPLGAAGPMGRSPEVSVTAQTAKAPLVGVLEQLTAEDLTLQTSDGIRKLALSDVETIAFSQSSTPASAKPSSCRVLLTDGNVLSGDSLSSEGSDFKLTGLLDAQIPTTAITAVQIGELSEAADQQWQEIVRTALTSDIVVLRRGADKLERIEGIIIAAGADSLKFEFSGTAIDIPVARIAGFRLYSPPKELAATIAKLQLASADLSVSTATFEPTTHKLNVSLPSGVEFEIESQLVKGMDFRIGRSLPLADVSGAFTKAPAPLGLTTEIDSDLLPRWETRRDIDTQAPLECLVFRGGGTAVFRLPSGFANLTGNLGLEQSRRAVSITVSIKLDSEEVFRKQFAPGDPQTPINLPIEADQRLEIEVAISGPTATGATAVLSTPLLQK